MVIHVVWPLSSNKVSSYWEKTFIHFSIGFLYMTMLNKILYGLWFQQSRISNQTKWNIHFMEDRPTPSNIQANFPSDHSDIERNRISKPFANSVLPCWTLSSGVTSWIYNLRKIIQFVEDHSSHLSFYCSLFSKHFFHKILYI
jgi:hypothetical protein